MAGAFFGGTTEVVNQNSRAENYLIDLQNSITFPNIFILGDKANLNPSDELANQFTEQLASFGADGIMNTQATPTAAAETIGIAINPTSFLIATGIGNTDPTFVLFGPSTPDRVAISLTEPTTAETVAPNAEAPITVSVTNAADPGLPGSSMASRAAVRPRQLSEVYPVPAARSLIPLLPRRPPRDV